MHRLEVNGIRSLSKGHFTHEIEPVTITLQALTLVEKAEPVQVCFKLLLRTNGVGECKMDVKSTWIPTWHRMIMSHGHLDSFQNPPFFGGRPNTKPSGDDGTPIAHNC